MNLKKSIKRRSRGFSIIELMIIVAIMADLALIAIPSYLRARRSSQNSRFASDLRVVASAFELFAVENGHYPADTAPGVTPAGMSQYFRGVDWTGRNSLGGQWDWDENAGYAKAAVAVSFPFDADALQMQDIDTRIDNGILSTGSFRERSTRKYAYIIE